MNYTLVNC